jgi:hypothetical protein
MTKAKALQRGSCLVNGQHTPGSQWERECPLTNAAKRSERSRKAAQTAQERRRAPRGVPVAGPGASDHVPEPLGGQR